MAAEDIAQFCRKVRRHLFRDEMAMLSDKGYTEDTAHLPPNLREEVLALMTDLREAIPNDFGFTASFEFRGLEIAVEYQDGNSGAFGTRFRFTRRKSMFQRLRTVEWDELRADSIKQLAAFEDMVSAADDRPANIPNSKEAADRRMGELLPALAKAKTQTPCPAFLLAVSREDDEPVEIESLPSEFRLHGAMGDCMATGYDILAIVENGTDWPYSKIEETKVKVIAELGPISRAKAERRFFV